MEANIETVNQLVSENDSRLIFGKENERNNSNKTYHKKYSGKNFTQTKNVNYDKQNYGTYKKRNSYEQKDNVDPYTAQMLIYRAEMYILMRYPYLIDLNKKNEDVLTNISPNSQFFVIKSFS